MIVCEFTIFCRLTEIEKSGVGVPDFCGFGKDFLFLLNLQGFKNLEGLKIYIVILLPQPDLSGALFVSEGKAQAQKSGNGRRIKLPK
ncbi:hypothetical protein ASG21_16370 [Chryseobacterium sp. Leaf394]|nr:hypothetical protein ASG21_16370 [Chryseobacterium sp. Leaf394]